MIRQNFSDYCTDVESGTKPGRPANIKIQQLSEVLVYPNPTDNQLIIEDAAAGTILQLFNIVGQEVHKSVVGKKHGVG